jgi:hypothetical protein
MKNWIKNSKDQWLNLDAMIRAEVFRYGETCFVIKFMDAEGDWHDFEDFKSFVPAQHHLQQILGDE